MFGNVRVLLLPGWLDSGPAHWQSRWEALHGFERVQQSDWEWPRRGDWMARLEEVVMASKQPALLVAHSLGCHLVAAWSAHSRHVARVKAAILVAPPDLARLDTPPQLSSWRPEVRTRLAFPGLVAFSEDDPFCSAAHAGALAAAWGTPLWSLGPRGHLNADSNLGDWPEAIARLQELALRR